jgi:hypothetical protein
MVERRVQVPEWEQLTPLVGNALETGHALLHSTVPMTKDERADLDQALAKLMDLVKKSAEVAIAKVSDDDLTSQMGASADRMREEVKAFNALMERIGAAIVQRSRL